MADPLQAHSISWVTGKTNSRRKYHSFKHVKSLRSEEIGQFLPWQRTWYLFGGTNVVKWDCALWGRGVWSLVPKVALGNSLLPLCACHPSYHGMRSVSFPHRFWTPAYISNHAASGDFFLYLHVGIEPLGIFLSILSHYFVGKNQYRPTGGKKVTKNHKSLVSRSSWALW